MAWTDVTAGFVNEYKSNITTLLQEKGGKLRAAMTQDNYTGEGGRAVEQVAPYEAGDAPPRYGDTPITMPQHDARWVYPTDKVVNPMYDSWDKLRRIVDPTSTYAINNAMSIARAWDRECVRAFFAASRNGKDGSTTVSFDTANQQIAAGGAGLTVAKLRTALQKLMSANVDVESDPLYCAISGKQHANLLAEIQVISKDYNSAPVMENGRIKQFLSFNFIHSELLGVDGSSYRRVPIWAKSGMHFGVWNDLETKMTERSDKNYNMQVYTRSTFGATRLEEGKVIECLCVEA